MDRKKSREELLKDCKLLNIPVDENDNERTLMLLLEAARVNEKYKHLFTPEGELIIEPKRNKS